MINRVLGCLGAAALGCSVVACDSAPPKTGIVTLAVLSSPNSLDPRVGSDETSQRAHQLLYDNLLSLDDQLRVIGGLASSWQQRPHPTCAAVPSNSTVSHALRSTMPRKPSSENRRPRSRRSTTSGAMAKRKPTP